MKTLYIIIILLLTNVSFCMAQKLDYYPPQKENVSDNNYEYGTAILKETYAQIRKNNGELHYVSYWNLAVAYMTLKHDDKEFVINALKKSRKLNLVNFSDIFADASDGTNNWEGYLTDEEFNALYNQSLAVLEKGKSEMTTTTTETKANKLAHIMQELEERDSRHRKVLNKDLEKQQELDRENINVIDSLYASYKTYIGKSLVGDKYAHVMWAVIQHSNIITMEKYLPEIHLAVKKNELNEGSLKLLIDRVYSEKYGCQIFGSQVGIEMASTEEIASVMNNYEIGVTDKVAKSATNNKGKVNSTYYHPKPNAGKIIQKKQKADLGKFPTKRRVESY